MKKFQKSIIALSVTSLIFCTQSVVTMNAEQNSKSISIGVKDSIHVNQIGYRVKDNKVVLINGKGGAFEVVDEKTKKPVFKGIATGGDFDPSSGDTIFKGDFSKVSNPGKYFINIPDYGISYPFTISDNVYKNIKNAFLKALYYQRCGLDLDEKYAGVWTHDACHLQDALVYASKNVTKDGTGGWHDAGDYGKYTVPAAAALADLMMAYDFFPKAYTDKINIPKGIGKTPDILNEARYELEWLLKMQDKTSGGVYHKLTSSSFPDIDVMPEIDFSDLYFITLSGTATGDFAAVMAMASRIYLPFDKSFSKKCLAASVKAWKWLSTNVNVPKFENPGDISTGDYSDTSDKDERFWAAAELYRVTSKSEYHEYLKKAYKTGKFGGYGLKWSDTLELYDVSGLGTITYLFTDKNKTDKNLYNEMKNSFIKTADEFTKLAGTNGYGISLNIDEYWWGSNMNVMKKAMHLIIANFLKPKNEYLQTAENHLHYLLGRNALSQSYVTGFGSKSIMNPHHRPSISDGIPEPIPGLVSGGPDSRLEDSYAKSSLQGQSPARCFADDITSYSTNEITIYWNTPAVFVAGYFDQASSIRK